MVIIKETCSISPKICSQISTITKTRRGMGLKYPPPEHIVIRWHQKHFSHPLKLISVQVAFRNLLLVVKYSRVQNKSGYFVHYRCFYINTEFILWHAQIYKRATIMNDNLQKQSHKALLVSLILNIYYLLYFGSFMLN